MNIPILNHLGRLCRIPKGAESILLLGLLSGYPVGAKLVADSYTAGRLDKHSAQRMLPFCNNAGPSFIFGFLTPLFVNKYIPLILWLIHMLSALITGLLLPGEANSTHRYCSAKATNATTVLFSTMKSLVGICGWVILFKVLLAMANTWFLDRCTPIIRVCVSGLCELVNGCISLQGIANEATRMILCACLLACGGLCIYMQTASVTGDLQLDIYIPGKLLQTLISLLVIVPVACCFGTVNKWFWYIWLCCAVSVTALIMLLKRRDSKK